MNMTADLKERQSDNPGNKPLQIPDFSPRIFGPFAKEVTAYAHFTV